MGPGAIPAYLNGTRSPEAAAAVAVFESASSHLSEALPNSDSGKELIGWGFEDDVAVAAELNRDDVAPRLRDGAFSATQNLGAASLFVPPRRSF